MFNQYSFFKNILSINILCTYKKKLLRSQNMKYDNGHKSKLNGWHEDKYATRYASNEL